MRNTEDLTSPRLKLPSETLAVSFSEYSENTLHGDATTLETVSTCKGGKSLFRKFVRENISTVWKPQLVKSLSNIKFGGYLQDPPTLLLQGESKQLQQVRDAWLHRLLKAPTGYRIDFVGDVTRIGARPLMRGNFVPLCDGICVSIGNVTSRGDIATQEAILSELKRTFPEVHSPSRELLHETLGKLIRNRKVFCTGPGYHLVTKKTYSGKSRIDKETFDDTTDSRCVACVKNREDSDGTTSDEISQRTRKAKEDFSSDSGKESAQTFQNSLNCSISEYDNRDEVFENQATLDMNKSSGSIRPPSRKSLDKEKRSSIVGKVADKLFRRRRKSSYEEKSEWESQLSRKKRNENQVRQIDEKEAIRLGYKAVNNCNNCETGRADRRNNSEVRPKRSSSLDSKYDLRLQRETPDSHIVRHSKSFRYERGNQTSPVRQGIPDVIPEAHRQRTLNKSVATEPSRKNEKVKSSERSLPKNNQRDVGVSCNIESNSEIERNPTEERMSPPSYYASLSHKKRSSPACFSSPESCRETPRRSKSLRLPRERRTLSYDSSSTRVPHHQNLSQRVSSPPAYNSPRGPEKGISYDTLRRTMEDRRVRRSMSSVSSGRESSYLHSCHFAPSVRIGSVIADHLDELERRRRYWSFQSSHDMSQSPALNSTGTSRDSPQRLPDFPEEYTIDSEAMPQPVEDVRTEEKPQESSDVNESPKPELDTETEAALKVAKRLAELDIKMTRQEWKDYFALKILPQPVEDALQEANAKERENKKREEHQTYFESTSGSVETVIDVRQRDNKSKLRRSRSSHASSRSSSSSEQIGYSRKPSDKQLIHEEHEYESLKRRLTTSKSHDSNNNARVRQSLSRSTPQNEYPTLYQCPRATSDKDYARQAFYTCNRGHKHLSLCDDYSRVALQNDNASLTEDSGFHSARDRGSLASWDRYKAPRGTFV